jgi:hypothetical protein
MILFGIVFVSIAPFRDQLHLIPIVILHIGTVFVDPGIRPKHRTGMLTGQMR